MIRASNIASVERVRCKKILDGLFLSRIDIKNIIEDQCFWVRGAFAKTRVMEALGFTNLSSNVGFQVWSVISNRFLSHEIKAGMIAYYVLDQDKPGQYYLDCFRDIGSLSSVKAEVDRQLRDRKLSHLACSVSHLYYYLIELGHFDFCQRQNKFVLAMKYNWNKLQELRCGKSSTTLEEVFRKVVRSNSYWDDTNGFLQLEKVLSELGFVGFEIARVLLVTRSQFQSCVEPQISKAELWLKYGLGVDPENYVRSHLPGLAENKASFWRSLQQNYPDLLSMDETPIRDYMGYLYLAGKLDDLLDNEPG